MFTKKKYVFLFTLFVILGLFFSSCANKNPVNPDGESNDSSGTTSPLVGVWEKNQTTFVMNNEIPSTSYVVVTNNIDAEKGIYSVSGQLVSFTKTHFWVSNVWKAVSNETNRQTQYYIYNDNQLFIDSNLYIRQSGSSGIQGEWKAYFKMWADTPSWQFEIENTENFTGISNIYMSKTNGNIALTMSYSIYSYSNNILRKGFVLGSITNYWITNKVWILNDNYLIESESGTNYSLSDFAYIRTQ